MKKVICSEHAPAAIGPYAQAIAANGIVFTSGQLPIDPATGAFPEGIAAQTKQSLTNVKAILAEAGTGMDQVIKTTVFLSDMNNFGAMFTPPSSVKAATRHAPLWRLQDFPRTLSSRLR